MSRTGVACFFYEAALLMSVAKIRGDACERSLFKIVAAGIPRSPHVLRLNGAEEAAGACEPVYMLV